MWNHMCTAIMTAIRISIPLRIYNIKYLPLAYLIFPAARSTASERCWMMMLSGPLVASVATNASFLCVSGCQWLLSLHPYMLSSSSYPLEITGVKWVYRLHCTKINMYGHGAWCDLAQPNNKTVSSEVLKVYTAPCPHKELLFVENKCRSTKCLRISNLTILFNFDTKQSLKQLPEYLIS